MNAPLRQSAFAASAPEDRRHRFTVDDMLTMVRIGVLPDDARVELIDGELIDMPADGPLHQRWTYALVLWFADRLDRAAYCFLPNKTLRLAEGAGPSPDLFVYPTAIREEALTGEVALLVIEQADSSLDRDLTAKAALYARSGVRDYWVIDLNDRRVHVHREPGTEGYGSVQEFGSDDAIEALLIPGLSLRLGDLLRVS